MKAETRNYETPQIEEISTVCLGILCSSSTASTEDIGELEDFFGSNM